MFGSKAVEVISDSKVPFIVIQKGTKFEPIRKIVMTIDLDKDSIQVVKTAANVCQYFNSELILIGGNHDDEVLRQKVNINMRIALSHLKEKNIKCSSELLERKNFTEELTAYCKNNNVDMLAATYYLDTFQILSEKFVQHLLNNDIGIPVLTIDAQAVSVGSQYSFMSV